MTASILALLFLCLLSAGLSGHGGRRMEDCLPLAVCMTICWLYAFYCAQLLWIGFFLLCAVGALLFGTACARQQKRGRLRSFLRGLFTPGIAVYLCMCILFLVFFSGNQVALWDELRLWAAVPKAMYQLGTLQLGAQSPIFSIMQSYPPGLPLLEFYFAAFAKEFSEGALFVGYACGTMAFFLPAFSGWQWKNWRLLVPCGLAVFAAPFLFTSHYGDAGLFGMTLFVDPILGVAAGLAFYLAARKPFRDGFEIARFSLTLMALTLLKNTGIVFAVAALACALILNRRELKPRAFIPMLALIAGIGSWKLLNAHYDVQELIPLRMHFLDGEEISNLFRALTSIPVVAYRVPLGPLLSFVSVFTALWVFFAASAKAWHRQERKTELVAAVCMLLSAVAFVYGYAAIYAKTLESFPRYMETLLLCLATYLLLREIPLCAGERAASWGNRLRPWIVKSAACLGVLAAVGMCAVWRQVFPPFAEGASADADALKIQQAVLEDNPAKTPARIYLVMAGDGVDNSQYHHRIFFDLLSKEMNLCNRIFETRVIGPEVKSPADAWAKELKTGADYVYVLSVEDGLIPVFLELSDEAPVAGALYRVENSEGPHGVKLARVGG